jgi:uncharacterized protein
MIGAMSPLRWLVLLLAALLLGGTAGAQTFPPLTGRVVDDAHLLDAGQVAQLTALSTEIEKASSRQFVVATIPDLQNLPIEEYGYKLGRAWKIGQAGANNGIILIVAPKDRKVRIEVGRGLEPIMTDAMSSVIINQTILPRFKAGDMPGGIIAGADAIGEQMKLPLEAAEQRSAKILQTHAQQARQQGGGGALVPIIVITMVVAFVGLSFLRRGAGGQRYTGGGTGGGSGIGSTVANVALWSVLNGMSNRGGGSGWGGGSSDWGGGGGSDGGGFSGGGGDFGGGGASGDW